MARERRKWTPEEDALLLAAIQTATVDGKPLLWRELAKSVPGRSNKDCRRRWCNALNTDISKGPWSEAEDERLWNAVQRHGLRWAAVASEVGSRNSDQCSSHWSLTLNPNINYSHWTSDEDQRLLREVQVHGTNWSSIAAEHCPDRTTLALKNRYTALRPKSNSGPSSGRSERDPGSRAKGAKARRASHQVVAEPQSKDESSDEDSESSDDANEGSSQMSKHYDNAADWSRRLSTAPVPPGSGNPQPSGMTPGQPADLANLFLTAMTPISSQSPPLHADGNDYTLPMSDAYKSFKGGAGMLQGQTSSRVADEMMTDAPYQITPPNTSQLGAGPNLSMASTNQLSDLQDKSGMIQGTAAMGLDMQGHLSGDPFAANIHLQRVSIDAVCSSDQVAPIMGGLVGRARSVTVKLQPYEP